MKKQQWKRGMFLGVLFLALLGCDSKKLHETPMHQFIGTWKVEGRSMLNGIEFNIQKNEAGNLVGKIVKINNNKWVQKFMAPEDIFIQSIKRSSNFEFRVKENKIGYALFSLYDLKTSHTFRCVFIDSNTIGLGKKEETLTQSKNRYIRVQSAN